MGKPIEQRVGGYNSQRALANRGFERTGSYPDVTVVAVKIVEKKTASFCFVRVNPIMVSAPDGKTTTLFKPIPRILKELRGKDYNMVRLNEGILDEIPQEEGWEQTPQAVSENKSDVQPVSLPQKDENMKSMFPEPPQDIKHNTIVEKQISEIFDNTDRSYLD